MKKGVLIIAEAGVNHNGSIDLAKKLIDTAASAGADIIKFQTFKTEKLVSRYAKQASYQKVDSSGKDDTQYSMLKKLELDEQTHYLLKEYCTGKGIVFLSTAFDLESIDFLHKLGIPCFKVPSGEITNKPYLKHIAQKNTPVILSTGMADMEEVRASVQVLVDNGLKKDDLTVLHCNTEYPTPMTDVNLKAMLSLKDQLGVRVGYSDHTAGIEVPIAAVALGAVVIEKHFTLDKNLPGPDHKASLNPEELTEMVRAIRNIEMAMSGSGVKTPSPSEKKNIIAARKSIIAACPINKGDLFTSKNLTTKRPGNGISPMQWDDVIGRTADRDFKTDDLIEI